VLTKLTATTFLFQNESTPGWFFLFWEQATTIVAGYVINWARTC